MSIPQRYKWKPAQFSEGDIVSLAITLLVGGAFSAYDYGTGIQRESGPLAILEDAYPIWFFFAVVAVGVLCLGIGMLARWHFGVWLGHVILLATYSILAGSIVLSIIISHDLEGVRALGPYLAVSALHFVLMLRTGPRPLTRSETTQMETILLEGGTAGKE